MTLFREAHSEEVRRSRLLLEAASTVLDGLQADDLARLAEYVNRSPVTEG